MSKAPKYPCVDGINRDRHISKMLKLKVEYHQTQDQINTLSKRLSNIVVEMDDISFKRLGAAGHAAFRKAWRAMP